MKFKRNHSNSSYPVMLDISNQSVVTNSAVVPATSRDDNSSGSILAYVFVPIGSLIVIVIMSFLVIFLLKKSKLDKLRHHLMPLYNFDPAEEEGDWESELLEDEKDETLHLKSQSPTGGPKLKFAPNAMDL